MTTIEKRRAGVLIPLFSFPSSSSWGIGDIGDIGPMTAWLAAAGQRVLQLLPINEMASGQQSPYSAMSAMAIDPIFISVAKMPEFEAAGGLASLSPAERLELERVQRTPRIDHGAVRALKQRCLADAFERFHAREWLRETPGARQLRAFVTAESWWLDDYALFRALQDRERLPWTAWPEGVRRRERTVLAATRQELSRAVLYYQYLQWIADAQWRDARAAAAANGVRLFGDLPFMIDGDSADVWAHQDQFRLDASIGAPPDAFSKTGQDWGMPAYRWSALAANDFMWLRDRARRSAALYDGYRVDHLVGFYRTYFRDTASGVASFEPSEEAAQRILGERVLDIFRAPGTEIIAEDLGTVPDFVRASLARLGVPGFRVFRWERDWQAAGHPFRDPADYPAVSVAASGTHDNEPLLVWWEHATAEEREDIGKLRTVRDVMRTSILAGTPFSPDVRDTLLEALFASGSDLLLLPIQDVFGWSDRINEPATVTPENWTFRLPWPSDRLDEQADAQERKHTLRAWSGKYGRV